MSILESFKEDCETIKAALLTMPPDEPANIADMALVLRDQTDFKITVVGCKSRSFFSMRFHNSITGMPIPGFTAEQFIKYGRSRLQNHCRAILETLGDGLLEDDRIQINYISGRPHKIANTLDSKFDLFIIPHSYPFTNSDRHIFDKIGLQLVQAKRTPVLFCSSPEKWQCIAIMEVDSDRDYGEPCVMNYLIKFLGNSALEKKPEDIPTMSIHSGSPVKQSADIASFGIMDVSKMRPEQQTDTILVASTKITSSLFRYNKLKDILRNWSGSILVFPP